MIVKRIAIFTFISQGKIFLQERGSYSKTGEQWAFFGGHLEEGETFLEGCIREVKEELFLDIQEQDFFSIGKFYTYIYGLKEIDVEIFLSLSYEKYSSNIQIIEGDSGQFFSFEETRKLKMFPHDSAIIDMIQTFLQHERN